MPCGSESGASLAGFDGDRWDTGTFEGCSDDPGSGTDIPQSRWWAGFGYQVDDERVPEFVPPTVIGDLADGLLRLVVEGRVRCVGVNRPEAATVIRVVLDSPAKGFLQPGDLRVPQERSFW